MSAAKILQEKFSYFYWLQANRYSVNEYTRRKIKSICWSTGPNKTKSKPQSVLFFMHLMGEFSKRKIKTTANLVKTSPRSFY